MMVIPAIDLREGRCVRLYQGRFDRAIAFSDDPAEVARTFAAFGAGRLHVVDLDGARLGRPTQMEAVRAICQAVGVPVQLGGGLRSLKHLEQAFAAGARYVILGTAAIRDPEMTAEAIRRWGDRVLVALDTREGNVAVDGWEATTRVPLLEAARQVRQAGVTTVIHTDADRDGTLRGVNLAGVEALAGLGLDVIASGGVGSLEEIRALAGLAARLEAAGAGQSAPAPFTSGSSQRPGRLAGVIVGMALYTGRFSLPEAIEAAAGA